MEAMRIDRKPLASEDALDSEDRSTESLQDGAELL